MVKSKRTASQNKQKASKLYDFEAFDATCYLFCRGGQIRTDDLLLPKQTRYRATLHPELEISMRGCFRLGVQK